MTVAALDPKQSFYESVAKVPLLSPEEEAELARRRDAGDPDAVVRLVEANLRWGIKVASRMFLGSPVESEDKEQAAAMGLMEAAQRFDPDRGVRFLTYATWWIRRLVTDERRAADVILQPRDKNSRKACPVGVVSLASHFDSQAGLPLPETLTSPETAPADDLEARSEAERLRDAIKRLSVREAEIVRRRWGLDGEAELLADIAADFNISRERVRQIENRALARLRGLLNPAAAAEAAALAKLANTGRRGAGARHRPVP